MCPLPIAVEVSCCSNRKRDCYKGSSTFNLKRWEERKTPLGGQSVRIQGTMVPSHRQLMIQLWMPLVSCSNHDLIHLCRTGRKVYARGEIMEAKVLSILAKTMKGKPTGNSLSLLWTILTWPIMTLMRPNTESSPLRGMLILPLLSDLFFIFILLLFVSVKHNDTADMII